jgi:hypothetical protein
VTGKSAGQKCRANFGPTAKSGHARAQQEKYLMAEGRGIRLRAKVPGKSAGQRVPGTSAGQNYQGENAGQLDKATLLGQ